MTAAHASTTDRHEPVVHEIRMKAIVQDGYGAPERVLKLEEVDRPSVGDEDVLIRVRGDLLDVGGKVAYIGINSEVNGRELARIDDPAEVATLVEFVLEAPVVDDDLDRTGRRYFIALHLIDGTETTHAFWLHGGELWRGIILPPEFADAVVRALWRGIIPPPEFADAVVRALEGGG